MSIFPAVLDAEAQQIKDAAIKLVQQYPDAESISDEMADAFQQMYPLIYPEEIYMILEEVRGELNG